jgi:hypothetical protein
VISWFWVDAVEEERLVFVEDFDPVRDVPDEPVRSVPVVGVEVVPRGEP